LSSARLTWQKNLASLTYGCDSGWYLFALQLASVKSAITSSGKYNQLMPFSSTHGFGDRLSEAVLSKGNPICVGLDPRLEQLPPGLRVDASNSLEVQAAAFERFCCEVIDTTYSLVPVVKPQSAFFEELGPHGVMALGRVCQYASSKGLMVIMDAKRNDIGTTAAAYAKAYLGNGSSSSFGCNALTVSPYLGSDSLEPFVSRCTQVGAGIFVLVKTSNPGSGFLQDLRVGEESVCERVADYVQEQAQRTATSTTGYGCVGAVVGATYPAELKAMRARMPNAWILIPGYGAQGGAAKDVVHGMDSQGLGAIINSSRGIIFAYENAKYANASSWQGAVEQATMDMIEALKSVA
jgi:orotidine-5'-phosphate decarboxylase